MSVTRKASASAKSNSNSNCLNAAATDPHLAAVMELKALIVESIFTLTAKVDTLISTNTKIVKELSDVQKTNKKLTFELELMKKAKINEDNNNTDSVDNNISTHNEIHNGAASTHVNTNRQPSKSNTSEDGTDTNSNANVTNNEGTIKKGKKTNDSSNKSNKNDNITTEPITMGVAPTDFSLRAAAKISKIFVTNCDPETSEDRMASFISSKINDRIVMAKKLIPAGRSLHTLHYVSFRVSVPADCEQLVTSPGFWPDENITARLFTNRPKNLLKPVMKQPV